jgi:squalene-hopene/tetraprenyl-beta-curcumene cyclase
MKPGMSRRAWGLATCVAAVAALAVAWQTPTGAAYSSASTPSTSSFNKPPPRVVSYWDEKAAAAYLDQRASWWMSWPKAARDHETFCVSCHTAVPYAMARPALRKGLAEKELSANEQRILDNVRKRVRLWKEVAPFYRDADRGEYKSAESRGTESVLNALILASHDASSGPQNARLSEETRAALENMWAEQQTSGPRKGAWLWLRFKNEPWEADDSDFYGATLAAIAVGSAPENYGSWPGIQQHVKMLSAYLNRECAAQTPANRAVLLWASAKVPGLIEAARQKAIITELLSKQQADGGWSLSSLVGAWNRHDGTAQEGNSDGYATGLIAFALQQAGIPTDNPALRKGLAWLTDNQNRRDGFWPAYSLNNSEEHHISPDTARFMKDAATAYAVLALSEPPLHPGNRGE